MDNEENQKKAFRAIFEEIITNQMRDNNPPETNITYRRLLREGWDIEDTRKLIGQCVSTELFLMLKHKIPFDLKRYVKNLLKLPAEPWEV